MNQYNPLLGDVPWWDHERSGGINEEMAGALVGLVQDIERNQRSILEGHRRHAKIYAGYLPGGLAEGAPANSATRQPFEATKALIRSICDTAHALIVRTRPRASIVTDGADWDVQQQAEELEQFDDGAYIKAGVYQVAPRVFHDSTWAGTGAWTYVKHGEGEKAYFATERCLISDIIVDEEECREHLDPANVYHRVAVRADNLIARYCPGESARDKAMRARILAARGQWPSGLNVPKDRVVLIRATHIDRDDPSNNRKVLACAGVILKDEPWNHPRHPFTFLWWTLPITGFYGDGVAYRQFGRQSRITYMYRWIHRCHELLATPTAWVDPAGGPPVMHMSNEIGRIVQTRRPPTFQVHQVVPPEIYKWLDELEYGGLDDEGISRHMATNNLPPGVDSAPAQRELVFKEGQRFAPVSQRWEDAVGVETALMLNSLYREHAKSLNGKKLSLRWADRKRVYQSIWPNLDESQYEVRPAASNLDAQSPAARTQSALELAQTGWLTPVQGLEMLDHPDLRAMFERLKAGEAYALSLVTRMKHGETGIALDEHTDLATVERIVKECRMMFMTKGAPAKLTDEMARFLDNLDDAKQKALAAQQAQQMAASASMGGAGPAGPQGPSPTMAPPPPGSMSVPFGGGR